VQGRPFLVSEIEQAIERTLAVPSTAVNLEGVLAANYVKEAGGTTGG
jgi:hypothetical protein